MGSASPLQLTEYFKKNGKVKSFSGQSAKVHCVTWNCSGTKLASGSYDKSVCIYSFNGTALKDDVRFSGHSESVDQVCWDPTNPEFLASTSPDKTIRFWDSRSSRVAGVVQTSGDNINMAWSPDGTTVAVGNKEDCINFVDVRKMNCFAQNQCKFEVNEMTWSPDGQLFYLATGLGQIHILTYPDLKPLYQLPAHTANCVCVRFDPTGRYFAVGAADSLTSIWRSHDLICTHVLSRLDWPIRSLSFSHDGLMLASASEDTFIDIASVETGECVGTINCESSSFSIAFHPCSYVLAFTCDDSKEPGSVKLCGVPTD